MALSTQKRVAVFLAHWELNSVVFNLVHEFHTQGYAVDFFLLKNHFFLDVAPLKKLPGVQVYDLTPGAEPAGGRNARFAPTLKQRLKQLWRSGPAGLRSAVWEARQAYWQMIGSEKGLLPSTLKEQTLPLMEGKHYQCLIGVEKDGLLWAGQVAEVLGVPFLYYSLELYNDDYVTLGILKTFSFRHSRWAERKYHPRAAGTIVQDQERAQVLLASNGVPWREAALAYLPTSILGEPHPERSRYLQETLGIPAERKIILYFGHIREGRHVVELAQVAQAFPEEWVLVMHGFCSPSTRTKIESLNTHGRVVLSLETVPWERIQDVIASADIGLALYSSLTQNERMTVFSSEKMALYMQCGVPFIAFDYPGYEQLARTERCGAVVKELSELPHAVGTILGSFAAYRQNALAAFRKHYDFAANFAHVTQLIDRVGMQR